MYQKNDDYKSEWTQALAAALFQMQSDSVDIDNADVMMKLVNAGNKVRKRIAELEDEPKN